MKTTGLVKTITRAAHRSGFKLKKHSPEILIVAGVVGTVVSTVMACKATTKASKLMEETKQTIDDMRDFAEDPDKNDEYTDKDLKNDLKIVYVQTGLKLAKMYAPSVILGTLSIASILTSNNILRKRNIALAAAYATTDKAFNNYRGNVIERFGEEIDRQLKYNIKTEEAEETVVDEKGKEKTVKKMVEVVSEDAVLNSPYARFFDESSRNWEKDSEYNMMFLNREQQYANDMLRANGHLFLNEVYDRLDIPRSKQGQIVGWIYDPKNPNGDNYVDFGIYNVNRERNRDFVNGYERSILLDFNVDGNILDLI